MPEYLEQTADKFTFRVATDRFYTSDGVWVLPLPSESGHHLRVGLTDYQQQHSGDTAFVSIRPVGTVVAAGEDFTELETIKVNFGLPSPVSGTVVEVNTDLELHPELVNEDAYGKGWLAVIEATNWKTERACLLDPHAYFDVMQSQVQRELEQ